MELDERLHWIETRVTSSLKPRAEELKNLFSNESSRKCMLDFCNNEDFRHFYAYFSEANGKLLTASFKTPATLKGKAVVFLKGPNANKVTRDNIENDVILYDCSPNPLEHLDVMTREVFLPLLSMEQTGGISADKLMDLLHRLTSSVQALNGNSKGVVTLSLPSIEVLSEAAAYGHRKLAVIHVLETFLIGWIKQIKNALKLDPEVDVVRHFGKNPGPLAEIEVWAHHLEMIQSINEQLCSPVIVNILMNLEEANSTYAQSFHTVKREIVKAESDTDENLQFLSTLAPWFETLHDSRHPTDMIPAFAPLMHSLYLVWQHSRYYHDPTNLTRLLKMISNEVVRRARELVGPSVLSDLMKSHSHLKDALQICASFRGQYLDTKDKADAINEKKLAEQSGTRVDNTGIVWHSRLFKDSRTPRGGNLFAKDKDRRAHLQLGQTTWSDSPWPARNSSVFMVLYNFMERCNDVLELVETTRHFRMLSYAAEVGGAGGQGLDALVREIHSKFEKAMGDFQARVKDALDFNETQQFERGFFIFRSVIRELESRLGGVLKESFKQCWDTKAKLRLLEVFEGTSGRDLVQGEIKSIVDKFVFDLTTEVKETRELFTKGVVHTAQHLHIPPLANKLLWLSSLKKRLEEPLAKMKLVSPDSLKGDNGWKLRDMYSDLLQDIEREEAGTYQQWKSSVGTELRRRLKQPLLMFRCHNFTVEDSQWTTINRDASSADDLQSWK